MNRQEISEIMPHRGDMLLLDEVDIDENGNAVSEYTFRGNEGFFAGHFPNNPIVPGVILCEVMAQTCCILLKDKTGFPMYTGLDKVRVRAPIHPGDTVRSVCRIKRNRGIFYFAEGKVTCGDKVCLTGEFSFAIINQGIKK